MADEEQLALLRQGVAEWNEWRKQNPDIRIDLSEANLSDADLSDAILTSADLYRAILYGANLTGADLSGVNLTGTDLTRADMAGANMTRADLTDAVLCCADLRRADLSWAHLTRIVLHDAVLQNAILVMADLSGANLLAANLSATNMSDTNLRRANLSAANLTSATLHRADLSEAILTETNMRNAKVLNTTFANTNLSTVKGLDKVIHYGPSTIGIDTLFRSQGRIPEVFLRGCGVPASLIEYLPSLLGAEQPIQFYSCFISYSAHDQAFAQRLCDRLQGQGLRVWFAPEELKGGGMLDEQIDTAIRTYDKLILVLSDASVRSKWVMHELRKARHAELANQRRKLFPIRLTSFETLHNWECFDPETGQDLADEVRRYVIPDFTHWKDYNSFEHEFERLLTALQAIDDPPAPGPPPEKVIAYKQRKLLKLRQQHARLGVHTPSYVLIDIEDIEGEIRALGGAVDE